MDWKIGEIKQVNGEWYQCVVAIQGCWECSFRTQDYCASHSECISQLRRDGRSVIFKKLEKVGKPIIVIGRTFQKFTNNDSCVGCVFCNENNGCDKCCYMDEPCLDNEIWIEIKQNKEDMEEKKVMIGELAYKYINGKITYESFEKGIKELCDNKEESKPTLKEFNLEAAKSGKPVCTRDGRKARIICFDRIDSTGCNLHIVALVQCEETEVLQLYHDDGKRDAKTDLDLMMLPEKKEGWVNVDKRSNGDVIISKPYPTRDEAIHNSTELTIDTVKIKWEE